MIIRYQLVYSVHSQLIIIIILFPWNLKDTLKSPDRQQLIAVVSVIKLTAKLKIIKLWSAWHSERYHN